MAKYKGFDTVELRKPKRSLFDLSHDNRVACRMGQLVPIGVYETLPNDTFHINSEVMLRFAPLLAPVMHMVNLTVHHFFVPNRLLWRDWEAFITGGRLGTETPPVPPNVDIGLVLGDLEGYLDMGHLLDYMGLAPIPDTQSAAYAGVKLDLMPAAAYYKIWYDYYRDRNYVPDEPTVPTSAIELPLASGTLTPSGSVAAKFFNLRARSWSAEYFDTALPWPQRGNAVLIPMLGTGTVTYKSQSEIYTSAGGAPTANLLIGTDASVTQPNLRINKASAAGAGVAGRIENIQAVNFTNTSVTINDLRRANALQAFMERQALGGSRYNETVWNHFHRKTSDGRLQRAEYLGGSKVNVKIGEVLTTAYSQDDSATVIPPANMAGRGIAYERGNGIRYNCEEHGFIISIMSVLPTPAYMNGSDRMFFNRNTYLDYPWPTFAHLGEQPVFKYEVFQSAANTPVDRTAQPVFGYQSRYADWKHKSSGACAEFRTSLDFWHIVRKFTSSPNLGVGFVEFNSTEADRIFAVSGGSNLWCWINNNARVVRSLPYFGTPML